MKLFKCQHCPAACFESAAKGPKCPGCGSDAVVESVRIHYHPPGPGAKRACDDKPVTAGVAAGLAAAVTCPACRATFETEPDAPQPAEV